MMINILVHTLSSYLGYRLFQAGMAVFALQKSFFFTLAYNNNICNASISVA